MNANMTPHKNHKPRFSECSNQSRKSNFRLFVQNDEGEETEFEPCSPIKSLES